MIFRSRKPRGDLTPWLEFLWYYEGFQADHSLEHVLPDGTFELVINLVEGKRKLFHNENPNQFTEFHRGWISGAQSRYLVIDALTGASMMGAHFKPGGAALFCGATAGEFSDRVVEFDAVWGSGALSLREQLLEAPSPDAKFLILERFLSKALREARLESQQGNRIQWAVAQFSAAEPPSIQSVVDQLGISHRHFIQQFRDQVGLAPKLFCRIQRFRKALRRASQGRAVNWAALAFDTGYYDQAHFINDFRAFSGLTPSSFPGADPEHESFVPVRPR